MPWGLLSFLSYLPLPLLCSAFTRAGVSLRDAMTTRDLTLQFTKLRDMKRTQSRCVAPAFPVLTGLCFDVFFFARIQVGACGKGFENQDAGAGEEEEAGGAGQGEPAAGW